VRDGVGRSGRRLLILPATVAVVLAVPVGAAGPADRDKDGLPDRWEQRHHLAVSKWSAKADPDRDGLRNRGEFKLRTDPRRADTDRDGLRDGAEAHRYRTNPRKRDSDGDGYSDKREIKAGTSPRNRRSHPSGPPDVVVKPAPTLPPGAAPSPGGPAPPGSAAASGFPNPATTGVPAGWAPAQTRTSDLQVNQAGAVVQDVQLDNADIAVNAPNVTIRRVKLRGGRITNALGSGCQSGMTIEDTTIEPPPGASTAADGEGVIEAGGYTARRVQIWRRAEGFRAGGSGSPGCGPIRIENSFAKIVIPKLSNGQCDDSYHSDGIQGYGGPPTTVVNSTFDSREAVCGTAPFFFPKNQGNTSVAVDRLLVMGGGYPFRLGVPGPVSGLRIVDKSWAFGPIDVACSVAKPWDASIVTIGDDYQVKSTVKSQPCNTESGS
jgi:hypothetical protein